MTSPYLWMLFLFGVRPHSGSRLSSNPHSAKTSCRVPNVPSSVFADTAPNFFASRALSTAHHQGVVASLRDFLSGRGPTSASGLGGLAQHQGAALNGHLRCTAVKAQLGQQRLGDHDTLGVADPSNGNVHGAQRGNNVIPRIPFCGSCTVKLLGPNTLVRFAAHVHHVDLPAFGQRCGLLHQAGSLGDSSRSISSAP